MQNINIALRHNHNVVRCDCCAVGRLLYAIIVFISLLSFETAGWLVMAHREARVRVSTRFGIKTKQGDNTAETHNELTREGVGCVWCCEVGVS